MAKYIEKTPDKKRTVDEKITPTAGGGGTLPADTSQLKAKNPANENGNFQNQINESNKILTDQHTSDIAVLKIDNTTNKGDITALKTDVAKNTQDITKNLQDIIASEDRITATEQDIATASQERQVIDQKVESLQLDYDIIFQDADAKKDQVLAVERAIDPTDPNSKMLTKWTNAGGGVADPYYYEWGRRVISYAETRSPADPTNRFVEVTGQVKENSVPFDESYDIAPTVGFSGDINTVPLDYAKVKILSDSTNHIGTVHYRKGSKPILRMAYDHVDKDNTCVLVVIKIIDKTNGKTIAETTPTRRSSPDESTPFVIGGYDQPWFDGSSIPVDIPLEGVDEFLSTPDARKNFEIAICLQNYNRNAGDIETSFYNDKTNPITYYHQEPYSYARDRAFTRTGASLQGYTDTLFLNPISVDFANSQVIYHFNKSVDIFQINGALPRTPFERPIMLNHAPQFKFSDNDITSPISTPKFSVVHAQLFGIAGDLKDSIYGYKIRARISTSYDEVGDYKLYFQVNKNGSESIIETDYLITLTSEEATEHVITLTIPKGYKLISTDNVNFVIHLQKTRAGQGDVEIYNNIDKPIELFKY